MNSITCKECEGCKHIESIDGQWCYMFENAPDSIPCGQHDMFQLEREVMGKLITKHPFLLDLMATAYVNKKH